MGGKSARITNQATKYDALEIQSSAYGIALPVVYGRVKIAGNLLWFGNFRSHEHRETHKTGGKGGGGSTKVTDIWYTYSVSAQLALCEGVVSAVSKIWRGDSVFSSLGSIGLSLMSGQVGQPIWSTVQSVAPNEAVPYSGIAYICGTDYDLGESAQMLNHQFEITAKLAYSQSGSTPDVNPADILFDLLTNTRYGCSFDGSRLDFDNWRQFCAASSLLMSPAFVDQEAVSDIVTRFAELTNSEAVWTGEKLTMIPRCEEGVSSQYGSYSPNAVPVYDLTDDDFLSGDEPVRVEIKPQADAKNSTSVEYINRANSYVTEVADAQDQADIDLNGQRAADSVEAKWICNTTAARKVAQLLLQRSLYVRKSYYFSLPWTFALLSPMDIVTLTDEALGLNREPVRIVAIEENSDGYLDIEAEELLYGAASAPEFPQQSGFGFVHDFSVPPGPVEPPEFLETPANESNTGLEVAVAVIGKNPNWGGCEVHYSLDGETYKNLGKVVFGALYGKIVGVYDPQGDFDVEIIRGEVPDSTVHDANALNVVGWFGGQNPEYFGIGRTQLVGQNTYRLSNLKRGAYGTRITNHRIGDDFILVEYAQLARTGGLTHDLIGQTALFKFCSFNVYGAALESLENVTAYPYTVTGSIVKLPPLAFVEGLRVDLEDKATVLNWDKYPEGDVSRFEVRTGESISGSKFIGYADATYYRLDTLKAGNYTYWVAPVDDYGNVGQYSSVSFTITAPGPVRGWYANVIDNNVMHYWQEPQEHSYPIEEYIMREGETYAVSSKVGTNGNSTFTAVLEKRGGMKRYWVQAKDTAGNLGPLTSLEVFVNAPPDFEIASEKSLDLSGDSGIGYGINIAFDRDFLIGPVQFPGSWAEHFERQGWNSPQAQIDAGYPMYAEPSCESSANTETWEYHFSSRGWTCPQDQIDAGYPIYGQPESDGEDVKGIYTWEYDYGTALPAVTVAVDVSKEIVSGNPSISTHLYTKLNASDEWTDYGEDSSEVFSSSFRYVKLELKLSGTGLYKINDVTLTVAVKKKTDSGKFYSIATDPEGTEVLFNEEFIDVESIQVQPLWEAGEYRIGIVNFDDVPNPRGFRVLIFNKEGSRVSGDFAWTARGY